MRSLGLGLGALLTALTLTDAAFRYGLFFDESFYRLAWLICLSALVMMGASRLRAKVRSRPGLDGEKDRRFCALELGLLLIALLYGAALLRHPASVLGGLQQSLRYCTYAGFAFMLAESFGTPRRRVWLSAALQASGVAVAGCALAGWLGILTFPSIVMTSGDARLSAVGARLAGFMQYPNFMGAVAAAYLVWCWLLLLRARSSMSFLLSAAGAVPYMLVLLLTESRGAWAAAALAWAAGFALLRRQERCAWLLYGGWTLLCGSAACRAVIGAGLRGPAAGYGGAATITETLLALAIACAAPAGLLGLRAWIGRSRKRLLPALSLTGWTAAVIATALLLPSSMYGRLGGGDSVATAAARGLFYRDAWKLIREAPWLGRGGDTWRSLFKGVQSQPYVGNEVHCGLLELVLDLGLAGLAAGALVMTAVLLRIWKREPTGVLPIGVLLLHAMIDFDMSFGYYWLLLVGWMVYYGTGELDKGAGSAEGWSVGRRTVGGGAREWRIAREGGGGAGWRAWRAERLFSEGSRRRAGRRGAESVKWNGMGLRAAMLLAAVACFSAAPALGWRFDAAVQHRKAAAAASGAARAAALRAALDANPYWTRIRIELAALAPPPERAALLAAGLRDEPQSVPLLWALGRESAERGDVRGAAGWMRRALDLDRFDRAKQTEAVVTMARLAKTMRAASRGDEARLAAEEADAFYAAYEALAGRYAANGRRFEITAEAKAAAEQCRLIAAQLPAEQAGT